MKIIISVFLSIFLIAGCNPSEDNTNSQFNNATNNVNNDKFLDKDGDGYSINDGDCNDEDPDIHPGATEVPDGVDNNCNGFIDDDYDNDGYGSENDCDDNDPEVNPMQVEICDDGIDNDCNGLIDMEETDDDGDGFSECEGDCDDSDPAKGPASVEDPTDGIDNNCNGAVDEILPPCDCARDEATYQLLNIGSDASISDAIGMCNSNIFAQPIEILGAQSYAIVSYDASGYTADADGWGDIKTIAPRVVTEEDPVLPRSCQFLVLFTGEVLNPNPQDSNMDLEYDATDPASYIDNPDGEVATCTDLTQIKMILRVPGNATGLSFDFIFLSSEYPEYVGTAYNDTFYAILGENSADATHMNVSFDGNDNAITVNNDYFEEPGNLSQSINGTGYEGDIGSASGWLTTRAPVEPNSEIELIFSIHDEGDHILDSAVVIDNFKWITEPVDGPITVE